jgi:hypothetical protein
MLAEPQKGRRITKGTALVDRTQAIAIIDQIPYDAVDLVLLASGAMPEQITDVRVAGSSPARPTEVRFPIDLGGAVFGEIELEGAGDSIEKLRVGAWPTRLVRVFPNLDSDVENQSTFIGTKALAQDSVIPDVERERKFELSGLAPGSYFVAAIGQDGIPCSNTAMVDVKNDVIGPIMLKVYRGRAVKITFVFERQAIRMNALLIGGPLRQVILGRGNEFGAIMLRNVPDGEYELDPQFDFEMKPNSVRFPRRLCVTVAELFGAVWALGDGERRVNVGEGFQSMLVDLGSGVGAYEQWASGPGSAMVAAVRESMANGGDVAQVVARHRPVDGKMLRVVMLLVELRTMILESPEKSTPELARLAGYVGAGAVRSVLREFASPD